MVKMTLKYDMDQPSNAICPEKSLNQEYCIVLECLTDIVARKRNHIPRIT
jgi:hypothetical protein